MTPGGLVERGGDDLGPGGLAPLVDLLGTLTHEQHGDVCPANWREGEDAMKPTAEGVAEYLAAHA